MKKFSKILCLVLVVVMMAGLCAVGTTAAYADADKITYTEAVDVLSAVGVLQGDDRGFRPADGLTRAEACKIIAYLDGAETINGVPNFTDAKNHWAASYIAYCASQGYVNGVGNNKFAPDAPLTGSAFAKMLLGVLGYDATIEGMTGADWEIAVAKLVKSNYLATGFAKFVGSNALTREEAAQMGLNALQATMVEYASKGTQVTINGAVITTGASAPAPVYGTGATQITAGTPDANGDFTVQLGEALYEGKLAKNVAEVNGHNTRSWTYKAVAIPGSYVCDTVVKTVNTTALTGTIANMVDKTNAKYVGVKLETNAAGTSYTVAFYLNGTAKTTGATMTVTGFAAPTDINTAVAKTGAIVEFIDTDRDDIVDVINVIEKSVATLIAAPSTKTVTGADDQVIVPGIPSMYTYSATNTVKTVVGYEGLAKDDVVLYYVADGVTYIEKAAVVSGTATGKTNGAMITVNSAKYGTSGLTGTTYAGNTFADYLNAYDFYLDNSNAIVKAVQKTDIAGDYAFLMDRAWVAGSSLTASKYAEAELLFADGTTKVVTVDKVGGLTIQEPSNSPAATGCVRYSNAAGNGSFALATNTFYTYTVNEKGNYELTAKTTNNVASTTITAKVAKFDGTNIANDATIFLVKTGTAINPVYTAYTGINNVPGVTLGATTDAQYTLNKAGVASYVFINAVGRTMTGDVGEYILIPSNAVNATTFDYNYVPATATSAAYYTVEAYVNGTLQTIKLSDATGNLDNNNGSARALAAGRLYKVTAKNAAGVISTVESSSTAVSALTTHTGVAVSGNVMSYGSTALKVTDATVVNYVTNNAGKFSVTQMGAANVVTDNNDIVVVVKTDAATGNTAEIVYIFQVTNSTTTTVALKIDGTTQAYLQASSGNYVTAAGSATALQAAAGASKSYELVITPTTGATVQVNKPVTGTLDASADMVFTVTVVAQDGTTTDTYTITLDTKA